MSEVCYADSSPPVTRTAFLFLGEGRAPSQGNCGPLVGREVLHLLILNRLALKTMLMPKRPALEQHILVPFNIKTR